MRCTDALIANAYQSPAKRSRSWTTSWRCGLSATVLLLATSSVSADVDVLSDVFVGGMEGPQGTSNYRIPALVVAPDGSLLAFAEGRRSGADPGAAGQPIDMVLKRSVDGGATWGQLAILAADHRFDFSDPRPLVDSATGDVHLLYNQWPDDCGQGCVPIGLGDESSVLWVRSSQDNGQNWSTPVNLNASVKSPQWRALNSGPGHGIQLQWQTNPQRNGRLVAPGHRDASGYHGVSIFSDDHGATWQAGSAQDGASVEVNESEVVELTNGDLLWDGRTFAGATRQRFLSRDGGETWNALGPGDLPVTRVDTSMVRYSAVRSNQDRDRILYAAPLGSPPGTGSDRTNQGVWTSYDEGKTFINPRVIASGHAAYSSMQRLADGSVGLLWEATGSTLVKYANFDLAELESIVHRPDMSHYDGFDNEVDRSRGGVGWSGGWSGEATFTVNESSFPHGGDVPFVGFPFPRTGGRLELGPGRGIETSRTLATPILLDQSRTSYVSLLISRAADDPNDGMAQEDLRIELRDEAGTAHLGFGVRSDESFYIDQLGTPVHTTADSFDVAASYFLVAKIVSHTAAESAFDQVFLKAFHSGVESVPDDDAGLAWTLVGSTDENAAASLTTLAIESGLSAAWAVDELRVGSSFAAVASNLPYEQIPTGVPGDVNQDGVLSGDGTGAPDSDDIAAFVRAWNSVTLGLPAVERVRLGDLDLDGATTLRDAFQLHQALEQAGSAFPFELLLGAAVPELSTSLLTATACAAACASSLCRQVARRPTSPQASVTKG
ncbi:MAG: exo-alpha-sialidase [Planctomycetales bacterium]|nr:exo-alpha-sialidase [Planctomycetales bacterium]